MLESIVVARLSSQRRSSAPPARTTRPPRGRTRTDRVEAVGVSPFARAAGAAAVFEFYARLLAELTVASDLPVAPDLTTVVSRIAEAHPAWSGQELAQLAHCAELYADLMSFGHAPGELGSTKGKAARGSPHTSGVRPIISASRVAPRGIVDWLLKSMASGFFQVATATFDDGAETLRHMIDAVERDRRSPGAQRLQR
jgi:hypothetical protein